MKYEEIKIGDVFIALGVEETVISKSDEHRVITTIDSNNAPTAFKEKELHCLKPIKEELPKEGLLVSTAGSLVYKLSDGTGYGFVLGKQHIYSFVKEWGFHLDGQWKPATKEQETKFVKMLKKECEGRGLFEDTKIEKHVDGCGTKLNINHFELSADAEEIYNNQGQIFYRGKFATPLKEETLELVAKAVKEIGDFTVEQTKIGVIILTPKNK